MMSCQCTSLWVRLCRAVVLIGCLGVDACVHHAPPGRRASRCLVDVLYFGRNIAGGGRPDSAFVSSVEWHAFADTVFRRWLPNGSTETDALGRYVADGQWVAESTKVVTIVHIAAPVLDAAIDSVMALYRRRFNQESVGRVRSRVRSNLCES
jgi:Protein of unknown function (DUF3574)